MVDLQLYEPGSRIDGVFSGRQADFAAAVKRNPTQVNHWVSGHRNPNGDTCREVESELGYKAGWMDQEHLDAINPTLAAQLPKESQVSAPNQASALEAPGQAAITRIGPATAHQALETLGKMIEAAGDQKRGELLSLFSLFVQAPSNALYMQGIEEALSPANHRPATESRPKFTSSGAG